jgi:hypothetical protein
MKTLMYVLIGVCLATVATAAIFGFVDGRAAESFGWICAFLWAFNYLLLFKKTNE